MNVRLSAYTGEEAYQELINYLTAEDLALIESGLADLPATLDTDVVLAADINAGRWEQLFLPQENLENFPLQAIRCLRAGLISSMTFCTSQMFYNIYTHPTHVDTTIRVVPIFNQETQKIKLNARQMISATAQLYSSSRRAYFEQKKREQAEALALAGRANNIFASIAGLLGQNDTYDTSAWDDPEKAALMDWEPNDEKRFYQLLKTLPISEQQFLVLPDLHFDGDKFQNETTVMREINFRLLFNIFSRFRLAGKPVCMIPTRGMMQAFLQATYGDKTPRPAYRLCLSPNTGLVDTMKAGGRDMYQTFAPLAHLVPDRLDGYPAQLSYAEGELHDFYHQGVAANIPVNDVQLFAEIYDIFNRSAQMNTGCQAYATAYANTIADMEHNSYRVGLSKIFPERRKTMEKPFAKFWSAVEGSDPIRPYNKEFENIDMQQEILAELFSNHILAHEKDLNARFGLTIESLLDFSTTMRLPFLHKVKRNIISALNNQYTQMDFDKLSSIIRNGQSVYKPFAMHAIEHKISQDLVGAVYFAYGSQSGLIKDAITEGIKNNFSKHFNSGDFERLLSNYPEYYHSVIENLRKSDDFDILLVKAIKVYNDDPRMFDMLYDKQFANHVCSSTRSTLLYHAVKSRNIELLFRLTSDGASVTQLPGSRKPSALKKALSLGRKDIQAILILANQLGPDWMKLMKAAVLRLRRLSAYYQQNSQYAKLADDLEWINKITKSLPETLKKALAKESESPAFQPGMFFANNRSASEISQMLSAIFRKSGQ